MIFTELECKRNEQNEDDAQHLVEYCAKQSDGKNLVEYSAGKTKKHADNKVGHSIFICSNEMESIDIEIGTSATDLDFEQAISELQSSYKHNRFVKHPFRHFVISLDENEVLDDGNWRYVVRKVMNKLGYSHARYIAFRHADTDNSHVHIVCSTQCLLRNQVISNWMSVENAQELMRFFEQQFNLRQLQSSSELYEVGTELVSDKLSNDKVKFMIRRLVDKSIKSLDSKASLIDLQIKLLANGVTITLKQDSSSDRFSGLIYHFNDYAIPASKLRAGNIYTLGGLIKRDILADDANSVVAYQSTLSDEIFQSKLELAMQHFERHRHDALHKSNRVAEEMKEWNKKQFNYFLFSCRLNRKRQMDDAIDFWLYHGKKITSRDKIMAHTLYEQTKGIYRASGQLSNYIRHIFILLFELSQRQHWDLRVTPVAECKDDMQMVENLISKAEGDEKSQLLMRKKITLDNPPELSRLDKNTKPSL